MANFIRGLTLGSTLVLMGFGLWLHDTTCIVIATVVLGLWGLGEFIVAVES